MTAPGSLTAGLFRAALAAALASVALAPGSAASSGDAYRVKDLRTTPVYVSYFAASVAELPERALLFGGLAGTGSEPWVSDGTAAGTRLLRNLGPGGLGSAYGAIGRTGSFVYFAAWTPATGRELWRTDGTSAGTLQLADIAPGRDDSSPVPIGILGDVLLFAAYEPSHGTQVWRTDGTAAGTWRISDLAAGVCATSWNAEQASHTTLAGRVYFGGNDGLHGCEPFASDGTAAGTVLVGDLLPGPAGSSAHAFFAAAGRVYFEAEDTDHGWELWVTQGTAVTTRLVADLYPGPDGSFPEPLGAVGGGFAFTAYAGCCEARPFWTDGEGGARNLGEVGVWDSGAREAGGRLLFFGWEGAHGREPWTTDGTAAGTVLLADLNPGTSSSVRGHPAGGGEEPVYFIGYDGTWTGSLWRSDGTPAGTVPIGETGPAEEILSLASTGANVLFEVHWIEYCGPHSECDYYETWVSDGSAAGTRPLWAGPLERSPSSPSGLSARPGGAVFAAIGDPPLSPDGEFVVFATDGSEPGTVPLADAAGETLQGWESSTSPALPDGTVLLGGWTATSPFTLWRTDDGLVSIVREPGASGGPEGAGDFAGIGGMTYFIADGTGGYEPWRSDGTAAGTFRLCDGAPGACGFDPGNFTAIDGRAWYIAWAETSGRELWESDGTPAGTQVHDLTPGEGSTFESVGGDEIVPLAAGGLVFRSFADLYALAPGAETATHLRALENTPWEEPMLAPHEDRVFFLEGAGGAGCELWATDGTVPGTVRVATVGWNWSPYDWEPCPPAPVAFAGRLFFTTCTAQEGCELWTSDGTGTGTSLFADLEPGPASLLATALTPIGDRMYFSGCTEADGCEPWETDGTVAGTRALADVAPGVLSSDPHEFTLSSCLVYFAADDGTGTELWAIPAGLFCDGFEGGDASRWITP